MTGGLRSPIFPPNLLISDQLDHKYAVAAAGGNIEGCRSCVAIGFSSRNHSCSVLCALMEHPKSQERPLESSRGERHWGVDGNDLQCFHLDHAEAHDVHAAILILIDAQVWSCLDSRDIRATQQVKNLLIVNLCANRGVAPHHQESNNDNSNEHSSWRKGSECAISLTQM